MLMLTDPVTGDQYPHYTRADLGWPDTPARYRPGARRHAIVHHGVGRGNDHTIAEALAVWKGYRAYHLSLGWSDIGYSFGWGTAGFTVEGRGWGRDGAHTQQGGNRLGHALALIGDGRYTDGTPEGWGAVRALIHHGIQLEHVPADFLASGHMDWWRKECPGGLVYEAMPAAIDLTHTPDPQRPQEAPVIPSDVYKFAQAPGTPVYLLNLLDLTREGIETHAAREGIADLFGVDPAVEQVHGDVINQFRAKAQVAS